MKVDFVETEEQKFHVPVTTTEGFEGGAAIVRGFLPFYGTGKKVITQIRIESIKNIDGRHIHVAHDLSGSVTHKSGNKILTGYKYVTRDKQERIIAAGCVTPDRQYQGKAPRDFMICFDIPLEDFEEGKVVRLFCIDPTTIELIEDKGYKEAVAYVYKWGRAHLRTFVGEENITDNLLRLKGAKQMTSRAGKPDNEAHGNVFIYNYRESLETGKIDFVFGFHGLINGELVSFDEEGRGSITPSFKHRAKGYGDIKGSKKRLSFVFIYKGHSYLGHLIVPVEQKIDITRSYWIDSMEKEVKMRSEPIDSAKPFEMKKPKEVSYESMEDAIRVMSSTETHVKERPAPIDKKTGKINIQSYQEVMKRKLTELAEQVKPHGLIRIEQEKSRSFVVAFIKKPTKQNKAFRIRIAVSVADITFYNVKPDSEAKLASFYPDQKKESYLKLEKNIKAKLGA